MPYVPIESKMRFAEQIDAVCAEMTNGCTPGELNYIITMLCRDYIIQKGESYTHINDVVGVLTNVILELNRRITIKYEEKKIAQNGDVY